MPKQPLKLSGNVRLIRACAITTTYALLPFMALPPPAAAQEVAPYSTSSAISRPVIFGEGSVSSELPEFASAFSPEGDIVYFNRMPADRSRIDLVVSRFVNGSWTAAELAPFSGKYRDVDPWMSTDGSRLYFSSNRPAESGQIADDYDTWYVERAGNTWSEPIRLGPEVNTDATEIFVSMTDSGTLYFRRSDDESRGIYSARASGAGFAQPTLLRGLELDSAGNPLISRDGSFLILSGIVEGRAGELYISFPDGDRWTPAQNMGPPVNTIYAEFAPSISPDGQYLFFTSERPGIVGETAEGRPPGDIYQIELKSIDGISWPE